MKSESIWSNFYKNTTFEQLFPENWVARVFKSTSPISFLEKDYNNKNILDLGCGKGRNIPFLHSLGFNTYGLEIDNTIVDNLRKKFNYTEFFVGKNYETNINNLKFDYILSCQSLYYLESFESDIIKTFDHIKSLLNEQGIFIFSFLGHKHSMFDNSSIKNNIHYINKNSYGFVDDIYIRPLNKGEDISNIYPDITILRKGEIIEKVSNTIRHLHYYVSIF